MHVLFLAYYFPPLGGAGVQRSTKFIKYLPEFGIKPVVLTCAGVEHDRLSPPDPTLASDIPDTVPVHRTAKLQVSGSDSGWKARFRRLLLLPPQKLQAWSNLALEEGNRLLSQFKVDAIYASASPYPALSVASRLSARHSVPWIADLRDPWALDDMQTFPTGAHRALMIRRMRRCLARANCTVMNTPEAHRQLLRAFPEFHNKRTAWITNGFDQNDFDGPLRPQSEDQFTIVHSGSLHTELGYKVKQSQKLHRFLGKTRIPIDYLGRSHYFLVKAIDRWMEVQPEARNTVKVRFVGSASKADHEVVRKSANPSIYEFLGYVGHENAVAKVRSANLLFLPMQKLPLGYKATIVPGKVYEYLASGNPILAAVPDGDAREFVTKAGTGLTCEPDDTENMVQILREQFALWKRGETSITWNRDFVNQFERRHLTERLAIELYNATGRGKIRHDCKSGLRS